MGGQPKSGYALVRRTGTAYQAGEEEGWPVTALPDRIDMPSSLA